jgi:RNA polymerase-binding transcription factor DksA
LRRKQAMYFSQTGICKNCGNPIPKERLKVMPGAQTCVKCPTDDDDEE